MNYVWNVLAFSKDLMLLRCSVCDIGYRNCNERPTLLWHSLKVNIWRLLLSVTGSDPNRYPSYMRQSADKLAHRLSQSLSGLIHSHHLGPNAWRHTLALLFRDHKIILKTIFRPNCLANRKRSNNFIIHFSVREHWEHKHLIVRHTLHVSALECHSAKNAFLKHLFPSAIPSTPPSSLSSPARTLSQEFSTIILFLVKKILEF